MPLGLPGVSFSPSYCRRAQTSNPSWVICTSLTSIALVGISRMIQSLGVWALDSRRTEILQNCNKALYNIKQTLKSIQTFLWKKSSPFTPHLFWSQHSSNIRQLQSAGTISAELNWGTSGQHSPCHIFHVSQSGIYPTHCMMKSSWAPYYYNEITIIITFCILNCLCSWKLSPKLHAWKSCIIKEDSILIFTNFLVHDLATTITFFLLEGFLKALCSLSRIGESSEWISSVLFSGMLMKEISLWNLTQTSKGFFSHVELWGTLSTQEDMYS